MIALLLAALASAEPDVADTATTTVGVSAAYSASARKGDLDLWLGERARWSLSDGERTRVKLLVDGRLRLDTSDLRLERSMVRALGVRVHRPKLTLDLGRIPVAGGGPRLVDGLQLRLHPGRDWDVGLWAGLAPDLFTTRPALRPGAGPIVAVRRPGAVASLAGEVLLFDGALDRAGLLFQARLAAEPGWSASARLDLQLTDRAGQSGLADASTAVSFRPVDPVRIDAFANLYSSLRYLSSEQLDPDLRRFQARLRDNGLGGDLSQDLRDPRLYQLYGAGIGWQPKGGTVPFAKLLGRVRYHPEPERRFTRAYVTAGLLAWGGDLELAADVNAFTYGGKPQGDVGVRAAVWPLPSGALGLDSSFRVVSNPAFDGRPGFYADLFVDARMSRATLLIVGVAGSSQPEPGFVDVGYTGFVRLATRLRRTRPASHGASGS